MEDYRYNRIGISVSEWKKIKTRDGLDLPKPESVKELEILSEFIFGKALHLRILTVYDNYALYDVKEKHDDSYDYKFESIFNSNYVIDGAFWRHVVGGLSCGGIATTCYGQVKVTGGHRERKRLKKLSNSVHGGDANYIRPMFVRLADQLRDRRSRMIRGDSALSKGREDAALGVSSKKVSL